MPIRNSCADACISGGRTHENVSLNAIVPLSFAFHLTVAEQLSATFLSYARGAMIVCNDETVP